ncbi:unnamed protein product [Rotaria sp. Silwood1]|nr:unnamed protein product [Rotaria sp. Silwood1]CAF5081323.1 unnamed protein product [Rotaria sp. Silwood1]
MFTFTGKPLVSTTAAPTGFTFSSTGSNSSSTSGTSSVSQPFIFGAGVQNTPTIAASNTPISGAVGSSPISATSANFTPTNFGGTPVFGTNQAQPATQPTNVFLSNPIGTSFNFSPGSTQATSSIASTTRAMFSTTNTTTTTTPSPFGITTTNPAPFGAMTTPSPFGATTTNPAPFGPTTNPSPFGTTTTKLAPFGPTTNPSPFGTTTNSAPFGVMTNPSPFGTTTNPAPFGPTTNPSPFGTISSIKLATPGTSTTLLAPDTNTVSTMKVFGTSNPTRSFQINTPVTTTTSTLNPPLLTSLPVTQNQPTVTSPSSIIVSQVEKQEQIIEQSGSRIQQQFLVASLLDPYANRGKKDFPNTDQIQIPKEPAVVSTLSTTTTTQTVTTSISMSDTPPIQTNFRKGSSSHSLVDVNFKLKPVSSSPALNDTIKSSNQQSTISTGQMKSTLKGNFTDEEELVLIGRTKMSKLRLSNTIIDPLYQSNSIRSLYPSRRVAELENLINITSSSTSPTTTTVNNQRISYSANENRDISSNHHSNSSIVCQNSSSPIIQCKSKQTSQSCHLPILTRNSYYMKPNISELKSLFNDNGECILPNFTVGHEKYGSVTFYGQINVAGLNLDEILEINHHELIVYPDDNNKPLVGEELNLPARITLLGVYPIDRSTRQEITDIERIKALNYDNYLRTITKKFDGEFINYGIHDGSWTFTVKHFTRYGLDDNRNDFVVQSKIIDHNQSILSSNFIEYDKTM